MRAYARRQSPGVRNGRVQKKNNHLGDPSDYFTYKQPELRIVRERPGEGYRHVLTVQDVRDFLEILPEPEPLLDGINAIVLAKGEDGVCGRYHGRSAVVKLMAWERGLSTTIARRYYDEDRAILERLGLDCEPEKDGEILCHWTVEQVRAYLLINVLVHELGHHHDRMSSRRRATCGRGEPYALAYAARFEEVLWDRYTRRFGL
jgi:hypothetical protein